MTYVKRFTEDDGITNFFSFPRWFIEDKIITLFFTSASPRPLDIWNYFWEVAEFFHAFDPH